MFAELLDELQGLLDQSGSQILTTWEEHPRQAAYANCSGLDPRLTRVVAAQYRQGLYRHQVIAVQAALEGKNVVVSTSTASGKTTCFALPVLHALLTDPEAAAIFFYPTKALAGDQMEKLEEFAIQVGVAGAVCRFDGDVDFRERKQALARGRIFICTPDVLHATMLKRNRETAYANLFRRLRFVILDECHVYSGSFGSNMAFLLRRLRQVCRNYGSDPQFLAASATIKDPGTHMRMLTGQEFTVVDESMNGSPTGGRLFVMASPSVPGYHMEAVSGLVQRLVEQRRRFLVFFHSRKAAEQQYRELINHQEQTQGLVMSYRSGFEAEDRRRIEDQLRKGELMGVYSTSALELGVDLPNMEFCVMAGVPTSTMGFWQRAGRVGRQPGRPGIVVIFPSENPIDEYYRQHPDRLFKRPLEDMVVHLDNRELIISHIACARLESGTFDEPKLDADIFGDDFVQFAKSLKDADISEDVLMNSDPHAITNLRCIDDRNFEIVLAGTGQRHGTITWSQTLREAYPQAIYLHMGVPYRVERILSREAQIRIKPEPRQDHATSPTGFVDVKARRDTVYRKTEWANQMSLWHTAVAVTTATTGYRERSANQWLTQEAYPSPLRRRVISEGVWLQFGDDFGPVSLSALNSLAHAMVNVYGIVQPCDIHEVATHSVQRAADGSPQLYIFDTTSGGLAISSRVFDRFTDILDRAEELLRNCPYCTGDEAEHDRGCPACLQVPRWYEDNDHLSKSQALELVERIRRVLATVPPRVYVSDRYSQRQNGGLTAVSSPISAPPADEPARYLRIWKAGSVVMTRNGSEATIAGVSPSPSGTGVIYQLQLGNAVISVPSTTNALTPVAVEEEIWCLTCGAQGLDSHSDGCPICSTLFHLGCVGIGLPRSGSE